MHFDLLDSLSLPGDPAKPNEDAFANGAHMAAVFDGATPLSESLMPGASDAQWLANFGARRLRAHAESDGSGPKKWLRAAARDAQKSYEALRRNPPAERYETPYASFMAAALAEDMLRFLWLGDCAALMRTGSGAFSIIGETLHKRGAERERALKASPTPAGAGVREEFLPALRASRSRVNVYKNGDWLFAPDPDCADHARELSVAMEKDTLLLIASDGFLALVSDYEAYGAEALLDAARAKGLKALGEELRAIEAADPDGRKHPRFKRSDDATALLLSIAA